MAFWNKNDAQKDIDDQLREIESKQSDLAQLEQQTYLPPPYIGKQPHRAPQTRAVTIFMVVGVLAGLAVMVFVSYQMLRAENDGTPAAPRYEDSEDFLQLQQAQPGEIVPFGDAGWIVGEVVGDQVLLICEKVAEMDIDTDTAMLSALNEHEIELRSGRVHYFLPELRFDSHEYVRIIEKTALPDGRPVALMRLTDEEMAQYGLEPIIRTEKQEWIQPAIWVNIE